MTSGAAGGAEGTALDHVVINVLRRMDEAAALFTALGFQLTPLGRHSLGSINHLMMTPGAYLELVGIPTAGLQRQEVLDSPFGLNGLVLKSHNADATFARLSDAGLKVAPPVAFSRPVTIDGTTADARFRTVRLPTDLFPAGRIYHCEHLTPDLVWHGPWFTHPNGFRGIASLTVASPEPDAEAEMVAAACCARAERSDDGWRIPLADATVEVRHGMPPRFSGVELLFADLAEIETRATALATARWSRTSPTTAELELPAFELLIQCRSSS